MFPETTIFFFTPYLQLYNELLQLHCVEWCVHVQLINNMEFLYVRDRDSSSGASQLLSSVMPYF